MLVLKDRQMTAWDELLPKEAKFLSDELQKIDDILDDPGFFEPFVQRFHTTIGRPTVKVETYIRMMYLKTRYQLGYETLVKEVNDSISWRRFCRIDLTKKVPDDSTLIKLTKKYGPETVEEMNSILVEKAKEQKLIRGRKLRLDTTVVESDIHYPTDARLLQDGIKVITRTVKNIKAIGVSQGIKFQDRTRSIKKNVLNIAKVSKRRTGEAIREIDQITTKIIKTAEIVKQEAAKVLNSTALTLQGGKGVASSKAKHLAHTLKNQLDLAERIIQQSKQVVAGNRIIPDRIVSIYDPEARPIKKGKPKTPTEFGYKALIQETEDHVITGYEVFKGNPADDTMLAESLEKHQQLFDRSPWGIATDRGFGSKDNTDLCAEEGVKRISLPKKGKLSKKQKAKQKESWFKRLQNWRAGIEARISLLKRKYGLSRSRSRGYRGTKTWVGNGILAYNLQKIAGMI